MNCWAIDLVAVPCFWGRWTALFVTTCCKEGRRTLWLVVKFLLTVLSDMETSKYSLTFSTTRKLISRRLDVDSWSFWLPNESFDPFFDFWTHSNREIKPKATLWLTREVQRRLVVYFLYQLYAFFCHFRLLWSSSSVAYSSFRRLTMSLLVYFSLYTVLGSQQHQNIFRQQPLVPSRLGTCSCFYEDRRFYGQLETSIYN